MRFEVLDDDYYKLFINSSYIEDFDINNNNELGKYIKKIIAIYFIKISLFFIK